MPERKSKKEIQILAYLIHDPDEGRTRNLWIHLPVFRHRSPTPCHWATRPHVMTGGILFGVIDCFRPGIRGWGSQLPECGRLPLARGELYSGELTCVLRTIAENTKCFIIKRLISSHVAFQS